ncbi:MAG: 4Fe-4S binding protein [Candidatus Aenigmarchaeota archaeon]|nr:4Fe-4S binding protein [Candidatus Aenigmarchaeota archaeon]
MEPGGVIKDVGSSRKVKTGSWRIFKPIVIDKCTGCGICVQFCPEGCIMINEDRKAEVDYDYCKGCLICVNECPIKAIKSEREVK